MDEPFGNGLVGDVINILLILPASDFLTSIVVKEGFILDFSQQANCSYFIHQLLQTTPRLLSASVKGNPSRPVLLRMKAHGLGRARRLCIPHLEGQSLTVTIDSVVHQWGDPGPAPTLLPVWSLPCCRSDFGGASQNRADGGIPADCRTADD